MTPLDELKHSIKTHLHVMNGPSPQLATLLIKVIDFVDDGDAKRRDEEIARLSYVIVESVAVTIYKAIETSIKNGDIKAAPFHDRIAVAIRNKPDDALIAKLKVLKEVAECYKQLAAITRHKYPTLTDVDGNLL